MSDYLPNHLWIKIFIRLPTKSIVRCISVCKLWKYLIKSQEFITYHLQTNLENEAHNSCILVHSYCLPREEKFTFYDENNGPMNIVSEIIYPFNVQNNVIETVGSCNGLLCLSNRIQNYYHNVIIWNPTVRRSMCLPQPNDTCFPRMYKDRWFGFGYNSFKKDYTVVSIKYMKKNENQVEIFRLSTHRWENISNKALGHFNFLTKGQIYLNGSIYWIGMVKRKLEYVTRRMIVLFDVCEEIFHEIELPKTLAICSHDIKVDVYRGSFTIVVDDCLKYSIWTLTKSSSLELWNEHVCIHHSVMGRWPYSGFMKNGDMLSMKKCGKFGSYNLITRQYNLIRKYVGSYIFRSVYIGSYLESLIFIDKGAEFFDTSTAEQLIVANEQENSQRGA